MRRNVIGVGIPLSKTIAGFNRSAWISKRGKDAAATRR